MLNRMLLRRDGEGVAPGVAIAVFFAILALIATSLMFPWSASAQEQTAAPTTSPSNSATAAQTSPSTAAATRATASETRTAGTTSQARASERPTAQARTSAPAPTSQQTVSTPNTVQAPQARTGPARVQPFALNDDIVVEITDIQVDQDVADPDQQIQVGDTVEVHGTWDARNASPQAGDEFYVGFPEELQLEENMRFTLDDGVTVWAECVVTNNTMNCVLTDAVEDRPEEVHGTFMVYSRAVAYTTAEELPFNVSGTVTNARLPGGGGISDGQTVGDATKTGDFTPDRAAIRWTIDIPGAELAALDPENTGAVTLSDELSANMQLCEDRLDARLLSGRPGNLTEVAGGVTVTQPGGAGTEVSIEIDNDAAFDDNLIYRVQYTSCTTSGEVDIPAEGEDPIEYSNTVTIGDSTVGGVGIGQDWRPDTTPSKSGGWVSGTRNSQLSWTIMVPGTFIADNDHEIAIGEELTGAHAVCEGGITVRVQRRDYLPGPGGGTPGRTTVTDDFTITDDAAEDDQAFTLNLSVNDVAAFDEEQYYYIDFRTCVTDDEVPDSGDLFENTATFGTSPVTAGVRGPSFGSNKSGSLNTTPTEVAGEEQPAGSTIDWGLRIPGHHLENSEEPVTVTDTFSDTLAICEVTDDLKDNLNLSVIARDYIGGQGANPTRDLTEDTEVALIDGGFTFTLPMEEGDYTREVNYDITYTLCTSSGGLDQRNTEYSNTAGYVGRELSQSTRQTWGGGGTGTGVARGSFSLEKSIHQFSEEFPIDDTVFTVRVEEFAPGVDPETGDAEDDYTVEVRADGTPVTGVNARGAGWQIRLSEIDLPHGNGVYFEPGQFQESEGVTLNDDATQAIIELQPRTNVAVELVNRAHQGSATVTKEVIGAATGELTGDERFVIEANIDTGEEGSGTERREFTLQDGQFYDLGDLPVGAEVTFTEVLPPNTDRITWEAPVFDPPTLVIGADQSANRVSVTNEARITEGTFEISKDLRGPEANNAAVPDVFEVLATWTDADGTPQERTLELPRDGDPIPFGENLPGGTEVTLTEIVPEDGDGLAWGTPAYRGDVRVDDTGLAVVTIGQEPGAVTVRNFVDTNDGTLRLTKQVSGEAADAVGDAEFTVEARWQDGTAFRTEELTVREGESTPLGVDIPVGTQVTFTETGLPEIAGLDWGTPAWGTDPAGESWLTTNADGTATGIVTDQDDEGALITLTNEAVWQSGSVSFEKYLFDGSDPVPALDSDLPDGTEFRVRIDGIEPALPSGVDFPGVGHTITLNSDNGWSWQSEDVLPTGTVITFSEVDPAPLDGTDWLRPFFYVAADAGEPEDRNTVEIVSGETAEVEIRNRPVPTTDVLINKIVTGSMAEQVTGDRSTTFEVTATWTDDDNEERTCILDVRPNGMMSATSDCDAVVVGDRVQFPLDTEITFVETGADTDVGNVSWGDVSWTVAEGNADIDEIDGEPAGALVTLTGDTGEQVTLELENEANLTEGIFTISKQLQGPEQYNDAIPATFTVNATWTDADGNPQEEPLTVPSDGTPVEFPYPLPGHTEVTLTEVVPEDGDGLAWGIPAYSGDVTITDAGSAVVTLDQEDMHVEVTNYVDTNDGTLRLTKQVSGEAAEAVEAVGDAEFTVEARWQDGTTFGREELTVREGESTALGVDLPVGTQVTFTEVGLPEIDGVEWGTPSWGTNPAGESWLEPNADGTATGIVSDDPTDGRLVTLTNEATWMDGSVGFTKFVFDGEDPVPAAEAGLPDGAVFEVQIDGIDPALPADVDFPAVGETITLDTGNNWSWQSEEVLPRNTVITFSEVDPAPLDGTDWARPFYYVAEDAGEPGDRNTVQIVPGAQAEVEVRNRPIPTAAVAIDKIVTGPKGNEVAGHESTTFQVTATWTDVDDVERSCILDVRPDGSMTPTVECDAVVIGDRVQFPLDTEITFVETGAHTDVRNVNWGDVTWSVADGSAATGEIDGEPTGAVVILTGDRGEPVTLELENETSSRGLIFIPLPIPLPPFDGGSLIPPGPGGPGDPTAPGDPGQPGDPTEPREPIKPQKPSQTAPQKPTKPSKPSTVGHDGAPGKPAPARPQKPSSLAVTGANVAWLGGAALVLLAGGTWLVLRNRRQLPADE